MTIKGGDDIDIVRFKAAYIGGHPAFTEKKKVYVFAYHNRLVIQPLDLVIPIADIISFFALKEITISLS